MQKTKKKYKPLSQISEEMLAKDNDYIRLELPSDQTERYIRLQNPKYRANEISRKDLSDLVLYEEFKIE